MSKSIFKVWLSFSFPVLLRMVFGFLPTREVNLDGNFGILEAQNTNLKKAYVIRKKMSNSCFQVLEKSGSLMGSWMWSREIAVSVQIPGGVAIVLLQVATACLFWGS